MNVLLTHSYFLEEDKKEQEIMRPYVPLGILYISAWLEKHQIKNHVYDTTFSNKASFYNYLLEHKPKHIGIYINLMTKLNVLEMIKSIKSNSNLKDINIILGGPDVRYNAAQLLEYGADYLVIGEGENSFLELIQFLDEHPAGQPNHIHGIAFQSEEGICHFTPEREKIKNINELPFPAREKINLHKYLDVWKKFHGKSALSVNTMRGCPYTCKWCSRGVYGLSYRRRSPDLVVEELAKLYEVYNPDSIWFVDDVFTISHNWLKEFVSVLKEKELKIAYECITRADRMNEEVIRLLKESGCFRVWIGAESGSQKIIDLMDRRVDVGQVQKMIRATNKAGIESGTFVMLGYPGEKESDIEKTINHLKKASPSHFTITLTYPIKGTELFKETETIQIHHKDFANGTDRDIEIKKTYPNQYYKWALVRVINEFNWYKSGKISWSGLKFKTKSVISKLMMWSIRKLNHLPYS